MNTILLNSFGDGAVECWLMYDPARGRATSFTCYNRSPYPAIGGIQASNGTWQYATFPAHSTTTYNITGTYRVTVDANGDILDAPATSFSWPA